jgi:hypothetical protein
MTGSMRKVGRWSMPWNRKNPYNGLLIPPAGNSTASSTKRPADPAKSPTDSADEAFAEHRPRCGRSCSNPLASQSPRLHLAGNVSCPARPSSARARESAQAHATPSHAHRCPRSPASGSLARSTPYSTLAARYIPQIPILPFSSAASAAAIRAHSRILTSGDRPKCVMPQWRLLAVGPTGCPKIATRSPRFHRRAEFEVR